MRELGLDSGYSTECCDCRMGCKSKGHGMELAPFFEEPRR